MLARTSPLLPSLSRTTLLLSLVFCLESHGNGLNRSGIGALSMGRGGSAVAATDDPFAGMAINPALLSYIDQSDFSASVIGIVAQGDFRSSFGNGRFDENSGVIPEVVLRFPLSETVGLGFSLLPEQAVLADWRYRDGRGGIDGNTSYGSRQHRSLIAGIRTAVGVGVQITDTLSFGTSIGALYNKNELVSPYTFQSHPSLAGFKTLLDLETEGVGINADIGFAWEATDTVILGISYRTPTRIKSTGRALGDLSAQFSSLGLGSVPSDFNYNATVVNHIPDQLTLGGSVQISDRTTLMSEIEWVRWSDNFDQLTVDLTRGSNRAINGLLGSNGIVDSIPLDWEDTLVYRVGVDHQLNPEWSIRAGWQYGKSPVPESTILPMTAAITEHTLSFGVTWDHAPFEVSLAYQHDLPAFKTASSNRILSGEYANSRIGLEAQRLAISVTYDF